jgi:SNF2 family DNA or RNA helicase
MVETKTKNISVCRLIHFKAFAYQKLGMSWLLFLREHGFGACLADDMGLGKTVQMIAYLLHVKDKEGASKELPTTPLDEQKSETIIVEEESNEESSDEAEVNTSPPETVSVQSALIVCPTSVLGNWQKELEKFAPTLKVHLHYGSTRAKGEAFTKLAADHDIVLTSYGLTHQDVLTSSIHGAA